MDTASICLLTVNPPGMDKALNAGMLTGAKPLIRVGKGRYIYRVSRKRDPVDTNAVLVSAGAALLKRCVSGSTVRITTNNATAARLMERAVDAVNLGGVYLEPCKAFRRAAKSHSVDVAHATGDAMGEEGRILWEAAMERGGQMVARKAEAQMDYAAGIEQTEKDFERLGLGMKERPLSAV